MQPTAHRTTVRVAGTEVVFETGRIARQAQGAVLARSGDNVVLATVTAATTAKPGQDFFPLTVEYREKFSAAGRIPGAFGRREGRISDHEVLTSRLIDRTVRSLFPDEWKCEVQVQVQVFSAEPSSDLESLSILAACAALHVSPVPANGPGGGLRIQRVHGQWLAFAGRAQREFADLEFSVGVGPDGLVMLEGQAKEASEADALAAIAQATEWIRRCHTAIDELRTLAGQPKWPLPAPAALPSVPEPTLSTLRTALVTPQKAERRAAIAAAEAAWLGTLPHDQQPSAKAAYGHAVWSETRELALGRGVRLDGRTTTQIRPIWSEVGLLPRAHGSALFTRGETQAIVTCTLGSPDDALRLDGLGEEPGAAPIASCCTTTSRRTRSARSSRCEAPAVARSATARWRGAACARCCPRTGASPTRSASRARSPRATAARRWRPCAVARWRCCTPACRCSGRSPASPWA